MEEKYIKTLETIFTTYKNLKSYLIDLDPDCVERFHEATPVDSDIFFGNFWFCDDEFLKIKFDNCTLVFIPNDPAIQKIEFEKHSGFLTSYFAHKHKKQMPISLEGYILQYNSKDFPFFLNRNDKDIILRLQAIQGALANPQYRLQKNYNKEILKNEFAKVFMSTKEQGYYYKGTDIFSNQALALLLSNLIRDGGKTEEEIFYYLCEVENQIPNIIYLHLTIKNLLQLPSIVNLSPKIKFTLLVFCHFHPFTNGSYIAERMPSQYEEYSLFSDSYYQSDHFLKNLDKRIGQIAKYNVYNSKCEKTRKAEDQLRRIKHFLESGNRIEQMNLPFHNFVEYIDKHWDDCLSKLIT